jgi:hypothetical protein
MPRSPITSWWKDKRSHILGRANIWFTVTMLVSLTPVAAIVLISQLGLERDMRNDLMRLVLVVAVIAATPSICLSVWLWRVRRRAASFDHLACKRCGFDLRGIAEPGPCPECGLEFVAKELREYWKRGASAPPDLAPPSSPP